jgi:aspartyl/asparaginyl-tRNA synthetase
MIFRITFGSSVEVEGLLVKPPSAKQDVEVSAKRVTLVGPTDPVVRTR